MMCSANSGVCHGFVTGAVILTWAAESDASLVDALPKNSVIVVPGTSTTFTPASTLDGIFPQQQLRRGKRNARRGGTLEQLCDH
mmetsp:Transcript_72501/g.132315  ORF Transcript_72501/g.132315 Transcript_72501/m.132315 type:complete len:84 (-) Transcript_72501:10-261(-)